MSKGRNSSVISVRLPDDLVRHIDRKAAGKGLSRSEWIARLIKRELGLIRKI